MTYEEFKSELQKDIRKKINVLNIEGVNLEEKEIDTAAGKSDRLIVSFDNSNVSMAFRLREAYDDHHNEDNCIKECSSHMVGLIMNTIPTLDEKQELATEALKSYDYARKHLRLRLVPGASPILASTPHRMIVDMGLVAQIEIDAFADSGRSTAIVTNDMLNLYHIEEDTLFEDALKNTLENEPMSLKPLSAIIAEMCPEADIPDDAYSRTAYVATNKTNLHGASVLSYPTFYREAIEVFRGSFWIIPSSIHELILIDDNSFSAAALDAMIEHVNRDTNRWNDFLSNHCYHYDADLELLETGENYERRVEKQQEVS